MISRVFTKSLRCLLILLALSALPAKADRIILKDGTIETSDHVWESERYVHFILQGTRTVEIRYAKEIVARIERDGGGPSQQPLPSTRPDQPVPSTPSKQDTPQRITETVTPSFPPITKAPPPAAKAPIDRRIIENNRGVKLYDPHRPQKYWATRTSRHGSISGAIAALGQIYGKSPEWIETHMGEENDLGLIHANLIAAYDKEGTTPDAGIRTPQAAALRLKDDSPPASGNTHEVPIEKNPDTQKSATPPEKTKGDPIEPAKAASAPEGLPSGDGGIPPRPPTLTTHQHPKIDFPEIPKGIQFYDPRRAGKYWTDETHHFNSLKDALKELAVVYGVSEEWIGDHLGKTNDLYQIHQHIRQSLASE